MLYPNCLFPLFCGAHTSGQNMRSLISPPKKAWGRYSVEETISIPGAPNMASTGKTGLAPQGRLFFSKMAGPS